MNKIKAIALGSSALALACAVPVTLTAPASAHGPTGINVWEACYEQHIYGPWGERDLLGVTVGTDAFSWKCKVDFIYGVAFLGVDMSRACRNQYHEYMRATFTNFNDPFSWHCYWPGWG